MFPSGRNIFGSRSLLFRNEIVKIRNPHDLTGGVLILCIKFQKFLEKNFAKNFSRCKLKRIFDASAPRPNFFWKFFGKFFLEKFLRDVTFQGFCGVSGVLRSSADSCETVRIRGSECGATCENLRKKNWEISPCVNVRGSRDIGQSRERRGAIRPICLNTKFWRAESSYWDLENMPVLGRV